MKSSGTPYAIFYIYFAGCNLRPSQTRTVKLVTNPVNKFELGSIVFRGDFPAHVDVHIGDLSVGECSSLPATILIDPGTEITIVFQNRSTKTRKWNFVSVALGGQELFKKRSWTRPARRLCRNTSA